MKVSPRTPTALVALVVVAAVVGVAVTSVTGTDGPGAEDVLDDSEQAYDELASYSAEVNATVTNGSETYTASATVLYQEPRSHRVEVHSPANLSGAVAGTNGTVAWMVPPDGNTTYVRSVNESVREYLQPERLLERVRENFTATRNGTATVAGEVTYVLDATPTNESLNVSATLWVDTDENWIRKASVDHTESDRSVTVTVTAFRPNVSIHDSAFQPPNETVATVVGSVNRTTYDAFAPLQADTSMTVPDPAFEDHAFAEGAVVESDRGTLVLATYDGPGSVTVVTADGENLPATPENATSVDLNGTEASYATMGDRGVVYWTTDGVTYAVTGDYERDALVDLATDVADAV